MEEGYQVALEPGHQANTDQAVMAFLGASKHKDD